MQRLFARTREKMMGIIIVVLMVMCVYAWTERLAYCNADPAEQARLRAVHSRTIAKCPYLPERTGW
jgi:hypothetical protein